MKIILRVLWLLMPLTVLAQPQRLVMLPSAMNAAAEVGEASTLCIDYFRAAPTRADRLEYIGPETEGTSGGYLKGKNSPNKALPVGLPTRRENSLFFAARNAEKEIPSHYKQFIEERINLYKEQYPGRAFTAKRQEKLQEDIWEYNILDVLGYIEHEGNPSDNFKSAGIKFAADYSGKYRSAMEFGESVTLRAAYVKVVQHHLPYADQVYHLYKVPGNRYIAFDGDGHIMGAGSNVDQITQLLLEKTPDDKNVYLMLNDYENETRKEGFITNANLESFRSGKRISFQEYKAADLFLSGDHYYVHHAYSEADITLEALNDKEYQHCEFVFNDFARTHAKAYIEAYALSKPVMTEMIEEVNASFSIGHIIDRTKQRLSLSKFLSQFKSKVKRLHNLRSEDELIIQVASQTETIGLVKN